MENDKNKQQKVEFDFYLTKNKQKTLCFKQNELFIFLQLNALTLIIMLVRAVLLCLGSVM